MIYVIEYNCDITITHAPKVYAIKNPKILKL